jgi:hypothetical protein
MRKILRNKMRIEINSNKINNMWIKYQIKRYGKKVSFFMQLIGQFKKAKRATNQMIKASLYVCL